MSKSIRIANGQGFWGDSIQAPIDLIKYGNLDYLTLDYLAEITISIMQKQKMKNINYGYALDFVEIVTQNIDLILKNKIKIITNAGGVNPKACAKAINSSIGNKLKIGIIEGDDILQNIDKFISMGVDFKNIDTGEDFISIKNDICSANVYIDSFTVKDALDLGADIVLAGRVTDPGLTLGPLLHEFSWDKKSINKLASGTVAGHIIECGAQCTGGNYSRWYEAGDLAKIGYPIVDVEENGNFIVTKSKNSDGIINRETVIEQLLYEMGDPEKYISPDVCVDFTSIKLNDLGKNNVSISNVKGIHPTSTYKVSISYFAGYKSTGQLTISGPNSYEKAKTTSKLIWDRLKNIGIDFEKKNTEYIGHSKYDSNNSIVLKLSVFDNDKNKVLRFGKEISPVITSGLPGTTGFAGGRPKPQQVIAYWPALIPKDLIKTKVSII